jgi:hypothetical protein
MKKRVYDVFRGVGHLGIGKTLDEIESDEKALLLHDLQASPDKKQAKKLVPDKNLDRKKVMVLQQWADENDVLLPTELNANLDSIPGGVAEDDTEVDVTERQYLDDNETPLYLPNVSPCEDCDD